MLEFGWYLVGRFNGFPIIDLYKTLLEDFQRQVSRGSVKAH